MISSDLCFIPRMTFTQDLFHNFGKYRISTGKGIPVKNSGVSKSRVFWEFKANPFILAQPLPAMFCNECLP